MLKFLIFIFLFFAVIYYVLILPFRPRQQNIRDERHERKRARGSNVNIDYMPDDGKSPDGKRKDKGDYIDYEEVKE